jgi:hypothetical protein|tara:strand:- start:990 stop:1253 length:264 start_codon:yes stop_codon:yes gene_type:complete
MSGSEYYDNLTFSYRVGENHENQPALFMWGIDCMDASCGFNLSDLNTFIEFLQGQRDALEASEKDKHQTLLFKDGFEMPTTKDEQNG